MSTCMGTDALCGGRRRKVSWDGKMYNKYKIEHTDGTPLKGKKYFVLRLDSDDPIEAARVARAMRAYEGKPRNCDIGTSNEHMRRFRLFCQAHQSPMSGMCDPICPLCGNPDKSHCITEWMLMPYSEGEGK